MHRESLVDTLPVTHSHCNESSEAISKGQKNYSKVDCVLRTQSILGESPIWDPHEKVLFWVDIEALDIHRFDPESGVNDTFHLPQIVSSVGLRQQGGLIVTVKDNLSLAHDHCLHGTLLGKYRRSGIEPRWKDSSMAAHRGRGCVGWILAPLGITRKWGSATLWSCPIPPHGADTVDSHPIPVRDVVHRLPMVDIGYLRIFKNYGIL